MKIRNSFISNSSSSSFILPHHNLSPSQIEVIKDHLFWGRLLKIHNYEINDWDEWDIEVKHGNITGYTTMANFDMMKFLRTIGVDIKTVIWSESEGTSSMISSNKELYAKGRKKK